jgi:putative tryptophan/tyrosine transport system substrate-binding protein
MNRRDFITLLGGAAAWPLAARAQQPGKAHRIGFLWENPNTFPDALEAFRQELRRLGYTEGGNLIIEFRWAEGDPGRMRELAEDLVRFPVDVIVAPSSVYTAAAKQATSSIMTTAATTHSCLLMRVLQLRRETRHN